VIGSPPIGSFTTSAQPAKAQTNTPSASAMTCGRYRVGSLKRRGAALAFRPSGALSSSSATG
jgi:hypothetical protein